MTDKRFLIGTAILCVVVVFSVLFIQELESGDETRVAGIAAEMFLEKNYLIPRLNGTPFLEYPPLFYWMESASFALFGVNDFAAKFPAALSALGCLLLVYMTCRAMKLPVWSSAAGTIMLLTSAQFFGRKTCCTVDMTLAFFVMLSFYSMIGFAQKREWRYGLLGMLALAGGVYSKGLLGLALPGVVFAAWMAFRCVRERKIFLLEPAVFAGELLGAVFLVGLWYWQIRVGGGEKLFHEAFFVNNLGRFSGSQGDHVEPFWYYLKNLPTLFLPWLPLLLFAFWRGIRDLSLKRDDALSLIFCAVLIPFALFSFSSSKRIVYLLPLAPPCAVLCAWVLERISIRGSSPAEYFCRKKSVAYGLLAGIAILTLSVDFIRSHIANRKESLRPFFEMVRQQEADGKKIYVVNFERTRGAVFFYLGHSLPVKSSGEKLSRGECLIVRNKALSAHKRKYADHHCLIEGNE